MSAPKDEGGHRVRLTIPSRIEYLRWARTAAASTTGALGVEPSSTMDVVLVVNELVTNAIDHGSGGRVRIELVAWEDELRVRASNAVRGGGADVPDVDAWALPPVDAPSGRGLGIVRALSRSVRVGVDEGWLTVECHVPMRPLSPSR